MGRIERKASSKQSPSIYGRSRARHLQGIAQATTRPGKTSLNDRLRISESAKLDIEMASELVSLFDGIKCSEFILSSIILDDEAAP